MCIRDRGNSKSPLIAMTVAALINVGLDLLFVAVFGWGVAGAAVATVIAPVSYTHLDVYKRQEYRRIIC